LTFALVSPALHRCLGCSARRALPAVVLPGMLRHLKTGRKTGQNGPKQGENGLFWGANQVKKAGL